VRCNLKRFAGHNNKERFSAFHWPRP
jgi:hypothetical protein